MKIKLFTISVGVKTQEPKPNFAPVPVTIKSGNARSTKQGIL